MNYPPKIAPVKDIIFQEWGNETGHVLSVVVGLFIGRGDANALNAGRHGRRSFRKLVQHGLKEFRILEEAANVTSYQ